MEREHIARSLGYDVVGQAPIGITICELGADERDVVYANDRFLGMTGYSRGEVLGKPWSLLVGPATGADSVTAVEEALASASPVTTELLVYAADGSPFWDRVRVEPLRDDADEVAAYVWFHEDVTDKRHREDTLQALHTAATKIHRTETVDAACEVTVDAAADILEFDMCSVVLREGEYLVPRADSTDAPPGGSRRMRLDQGLAGDTYRTGESTVVEDVDDDPTSDPARDSYRSGISVPVGEYGVFQAVKEETGGFDDEDVELAELLVTHTASAIGRIEREQELKRQNDRLESFVNVVSHDLRNPLNVLAGSLQMAEETGDTEHFERGERAVDRMRRLIDDLLELARQGAQVEEMTTVDVASLAEKAWGTVVTADATLSVDTDAEIRAHEGRFRQLLENLFRNAVEHGSTSRRSQAHDDAASASVTVTVGRLADVPGLFVADDGPGIPAGEREHVFENGYSTSGNGTGFGLAIVEQIAAAHDWEIRVTESADGGARFEVTGVDVVSATTDD